MSTSWTKRHSHEEDLAARRRKRAKYDAWKSSWMKSRGKWTLKVGDSWNPRLNCWNNEVYRGERFPEGHEKQGQLTEKGEELATSGRPAVRKLPPIRKAVLRTVRAEG